MTNYLLLLTKFTALLIFGLPVSKNPHSKYKLDFTTSYNQFYIADKTSPRTTNAATFWSNEAFKQRLAVGDGVLGVGIQSYGHVKGELDLLQNAPSNTVFSKYDHVVEAGIDIRSGVLQVIDCPDNEIELTIKVKPGRYRVRISAWGFAGTIIDEDEGNDHYKVEIWPIKEPGNMSRVVLKQYPLEQ